MIFWHFSEVSVQLDEMDSDDEDSDGEQDQDEQNVLNGNYMIYAKQEVYVNLSPPMHDRKRL